jgi:hypothetical protein
MFREKYSTLSGSRARPGITFIGSRHRGRVLKFRVSAPLRLHSRVYALLHGGDFSSGIIKCAALIIFLCPKNTRGIFDPFRVVKKKS